MVDPRPRRRLDRGMKATLFALFVALLMVGCGEWSNPSGGVDMTDTAPKKDAIQTAVDLSKLQDRSGVKYLPNEENPFTGIKAGRKRRFILNLVPNDMPTEAIRKMCINFNKAQQQGRIYMNKKLGYNDRFVKASAVKFQSSRRSRLADRGNSYIIENGGETSENRQNNDI